MNGMVVKNRRRLRSWCRCKPEETSEDVLGYLMCNCGEEHKIFQWNWEDDSSTNRILSNQNLEVLFHPHYSSGTAFVKGTLPMRANLHYYWEIKVLTVLYGTDVMIGVGTSSMRLSDWKLHFCSVLGGNEDSWGYSYTGRIQHNQLSYSYGSTFTIGSLVGVHLDMCNGTLEYYLNRRPLGIAFSNLKEHELYPLLCSTAAHSAIRITCCFSLPASLQMECLKIVGKHPKLLRQFRKFSGLVDMLQKKYFWLIPPQRRKDK
ncbi:hypothetical protein FQA39_LY01355 [Lamprigera yunnana]|nr:hypothetical protein FQA39_LY01355 [Lamprigera yunnana]